MNRFVVVVALFGTCLSGCDLPFGIGNDDPPSKLVETRWQLERGERNAQEIEVDSVEAYVRFTNRKSPEKKKMWQAGGHGGCNGFGMTYRADGRELHVGELWSTLIGCEDRRGTIERFFFDVLGNASHYELESGRLVIYGEGGGKLVLKARAPSSAE